MSSAAFQRRTRPSRGPDVTTIQHAVQEIHTDDEPQTGEKFQDVKLLSVEKLQTVEKRLSAEKTEMEL